MQNIKIIGYIQKSNIERMERGSISGFMVCEESSNKFDCAVMTVEQHLQIIDQILKTKQE